MRRLFLICAVAATILFAPVAVPRAEAMTITAPAGISAVVQDNSLAQSVAYICRRVWRCGYWGCGWRRSCWWRPGPYYGYGYYRPYWHRSWGWRRHYWW